MKETTNGQILEIASRIVRDVDWSLVDGDGLQREVINLKPEEFGGRFTAFLKNGARLVIGEPRILPIDRFKPFNPAEFIGAGWSIWRGPADGNGLVGEEERDYRSSTLNQLDLSKVQLATCLKQGESVTTGEERLKRLKADGRIRLDENAFQAFWNNKEAIPSRFKERVNGNIQFIFFDGVLLRSPRGNRCALYLDFGSGGSWGWDYSWLDRGRHVHDPSAVLASQN